MQEEGRASERRAEAAQPRHMAAKAIPCAKRCYCAVLRDKRDERAGRIPDPSAEMCRQASKAEEKQSTKLKARGASARLSRAASTTV